MSHFQCQKAVEGFPKGANFMQCKDNRKRIIHGRTKMQYKYIRSKNMRGASMGVDIIQELTKRSG